MKTTMHVLLLIGLYFCIPRMASGQTPNSNAIKGEEQAISLTVLNHVFLQLKDKANWSHESSFEEECDLTAEKQALRCAIRKAQIELTGRYEHRNYLMRVIRQKIRQHFFCRQGIHPIDNFNKHKKTSHEDILFLLKMVKEELEKQEASL
ncbi:MAG: hypothetical protein ACRBFS_02560 [Aureispira sp.]